MTTRPRTKTWAVLPTLGLLTWAAGCHSEAPAPPAAAVSAAPVPEPAPGPAPAVARADEQPAVVEALTPSQPEAVAPPGADADVPAPPTEPVKDVVIGAERIPVGGFEPTVDKAVGQAGVKGKAVEPAAVPPAPAAPPVPVAPAVTPLIEGVQSVADGVKTGARKAAGEITRNVQKELDQTVSDLQQEAQVQAQKATEDLVKKVDQGTRDVIAKGLKRAAGGVKKEPARGR